MSKNVVLGFLAGAAAGAIIGVLFAPDKGSKTRKKIARKSIEAGDSLKEAFDDFVETVKDKYARIEEKGKSKMNALKKEAKEV